MKQALVLVALLALPQLITSTARAQNSNVERAVRNVDDERIAALVHNDIPMLERIMTADFTYTHSTGQVETKAEFLDAFKSGKRIYRSLKEEDLQVRFYGKVAVITGRCTLTGTNAGKDFVLPMRFIEIYTNNDGKWQWVTWQSTRLAP